MKIAKTMILAVLAVMCIAGAASAKIIEEMAVEYAVAGGVSLTGNIYRPDGSGSYPGIIYVHGGGFVAGSKDIEGNLKIGRMLAENGFVVFSVDYRLVQQGGVLPNSVRDVKTALCWFRKNGVSHGLDPSRIGSLGESAGGTLVALLATTAGVPDFAPYGADAVGCDDSVLATVAVFPATDFSTLKTNLAKMVKGEMKRAYGIRKPEVLAELMAKQSPINYAANAGPMMFIHGANDILVTVDQSRSMSAKLKSLGKDVEYIELEDAPHGFFGENFTKPEYEKVRVAAVEFLKKHLGKK